MSDDKVPPVKQPTDTQLEDYKKSVKVIYNIAQLYFIYKFMENNILITCEPPTRL